MTQSRKAATLCLCVVGLVCLVAKMAATPQQQTAPSTSEQVATPAGEMVATYCVSCHNPKLKTANFVINPDEAARVSSAPDTWEKIVSKLRTRAMPPPRSRRPDSHTY